MNNDFNLDNFKEDFKTASTPKKEARSIRNMLNKSSLDNVKYVLIISIIEFFLFLTFYIIERFVGENNDMSDIITQFPSSTLEEISNITFVYRVLYAVFLLISLGFIITFYKIYKNLRVDQTIKSFTQDIIKFRQKANYFIAYNVAVFILFWISLTVLLVEQTKYIVEARSIPMKANYITNIYVASFVIFLIFIGLIFVYYRYFWGMFLGRLRRNQKELEEIDK